MRISRLGCFFRCHDWQERGCGPINVFGLQEDTEVYCRRCNEPINEKDEQEFVRLADRAHHQMLALLSNPKRHEFLPSSGLDGDVDKCWACKKGREVHRQKVLERVNG